MKRNIKCEAMNACPECGGQHLTVEVTAALNWTPASQPLTFDLVRSNLHYFSASEVMVMGDSFVRCDHCEWEGTASDLIEVIPENLCKRCGAMMYEAEPDVLVCMDDLCFYARRISDGVDGYACCLTGDCPVPDCSCKLGPAPDTRTFREV